SSITRMTNGPLVAPAAGPVQAMPATIPQAAASLRIVHGPLGRIWNQVFIAAPCFEQTFRTPPHHPVRACRDITPQAGWEEKETGPRITERTVFCRPLPVEAVEGRGGFWRLM